MSEYQYYEFQAVDRPLGDKEMAALRRLSTRARITATSFVNHYDYGGFKGSPAALMERYFDLHLYLANWGTRCFMLRLPRRLLDLELARTCCAGEAAEIRTTKEHAILEFHSDDEEGDDWEEDGKGWMASLTPVRAELLRGDLRCLYLAWLLCVQAGAVEGDAREPPVPPGLAKLSAPLEAFAEFLRLDRDLLDAAAAAGGDDRSDAARAWIAAGIRALPDDEKTALLLRFIEGGDPHLGAELRRRFADDGSARDAGGRRTAAGLLAAAEARANARRRRDAKRAAAEQARREREQAAARAKHLDALAAREDEAWRETDALMESKKPASYGRAIELLKDLRDLGARRGDDAGFALRLRQLRERHARKSSLLARFAAAGLAA